MSEEFSLIFSTKKELQRSSEVFSSLWYNLNMIKIINTINNYTPKQLNECCPGAKNNRTIKINSELTAMHEEVIKICVRSKELYYV